MEQVKYIYRLSIICILTSMLLPACGVSYQINRTSKMQLGLMGKDDGYLESASTIILPSDSPVCNIADLPPDFKFSCIGGYGHIIRYGSPDLNFVWLRSGCTDFSVSIPRKGLNLNFNILPAGIIYQPYEITKRKEGRDIKYYPSEFESIGFSSNGNTINSYIFHIPKDPRPTGTEWTVLLKSINHTPEISLTLRFRQTGTKTL